MSIRAGLASERAFNAVEPDVFGLIPDAPLWRVGDRPTPFGLSRRPILTVRFSSAEHEICTSAFYAYVHNGQWHHACVPNLRKNLADSLRAKRGAIAQDAFARAIGIHQSSVNRLEQGLQNVTIDTLQLLCDRLKCKASDLLDDHLSE